MIKISNRGNVFGVIKHAENTQEYLEEAIKSGFNVKVDLWVINNQMCSGESYPSYRINFNEILTPGKVLFEIKNNAAFSFIVNHQLHGFIKNENGITFTSKGIPLSYGPNIADNTVAFFPENEPHDKIKKMNLIGICGDFIGNYL